MIAIIPKSATFELRVPGHTEERGAAAHHVSLWATEDGYSLVAADGAVLFRGSGRGGRRECLEHARQHGVLVMRG